MAPVTRSKNHSSRMHRVADESPAVKEAMEEDENEVSLNDSDGEGDGENGDYFPFPGLTNEISSRVVLALESDSEDDWDLSKCPPLDTSTLKDLVVGDSMDQEENELRTNGRPSRRDCRANSKDSKNSGMGDVTMEDDDSTHRMDSSVAEEVELRTNGRSSRRISRAVKYADSLEDSDGDEELPVKKKSRTEPEKAAKALSIFDSSSESEEEEEIAGKVNDTELDCPECEYRTRSVEGLMVHLRTKHSTTPTLAGLVLRCDCGHESASEKHTRNCTRTNTIVVHKRHGPIRRLEDAKIVLDSMNESDRDDPPTKKSRSERESTGKKRKSSKERSAQSKSVMKIRKALSIFESSSESENEEETGAKINDTELECPECEYSTRSVEGLMVHLRNTHSTTPALAGLALRCDCGHEGHSEKHSRKCARTNSTVVRRRNGPIRRFEDAKTTPQCVLCEAYPKTLRAYAAHLDYKHKSTLKANGIYLKCACDFKLSSNNKSRHDTTCDGRQYTLVVKNYKNCHPKAVFGC